MISWLGRNKSQFNNFKASELNMQEYKEAAEKRRTKGESESSEDDSEKDAYDETDFQRLTVKNKTKMQRTSVSAEVFGSHNKKEDFKPRVITKTLGQQNKIKDKLNSSFLFSNLDTNEKKIVVDAMKILNFDKGESVIEEGQDGDCLYVVGEGELDCLKKFKDIGEKFLKTYYSGESFGELALLYGVARQASIRAKTNCTLFELDRQTFNNIVKDAAQKKREKYESFLNSVDILKTLDNYERSKIADAVIPIKVDEGEYIIKEGENGDDFFLVQDGTLVALKNQSNIYILDGEEKQVFDYKSGSYFGELALLNSEPRKASIKSTSPTTVLTLDKRTFQRILGPITDILSRNQEQYAKYVKKD